MWKIKLNPADRVFSQCVRLIFPNCARCGSRVELNDKGLPVSHQCSHYHGRGHEGTRFELDNVTTLCAPCHRLWEGEERGDYTNFMIKKLGGMNNYNILRFKANSYHKKDRKLELLKARALLKTLL